MWFFSETGMKSDHNGTSEKSVVNFRQKIDPATAHDSYSAWRERDHDDLVLALALACWLGERLGSQAPKVDLSRAFIATPPFSGSGPTRPSRPRPWSQRVYGESENPTSGPEDWDDIKQRVADGTEDIPDRSPWVD